MWVHSITELLTFQNIDSLESSSALHMWLVLAIHSMRCDILSGMCPKEVSDAQDKWPCQDQSRLLYFLVQHPLYHEEHCSSLYLDEESSSFATSCDDLIEELEYMERVQIH